MAFWETHVVPSLSEMNCTIGLYYSLSYNCLIDCPIGCSTGCSISPWPAAPTGFGAESRYLNYLFSSVQSSLSSGRRFFTLLPRMERRKNMNQIILEDWPMTSPPKLFGSYFFASGFFGGKKFALKSSSIVTKSVTTKFVQHGISMFT